tara:strand:+ start:779 stop:937 length:159 start_codon:yes stop_codon:yes gene_type:complete
MNVTKVKRLAHQLKELASELEDAIKEDTDAYTSATRAPFTPSYTYKDEYEGN